MNKTMRVFFSETRHMFVCNFNFSPLFIGLICITRHNNVTLMSLPIWRQNCQKFDIKDKMLKSRTLFYYFISIEASYRVAECKLVWVDFYILNTVKANIFYISLNMDKEIATHTKKKNSQKSGKCFRLTISCMNPSSTSSMSKKRSSCFSENISHLSK